MLRKGTFWGGLSAGVFVGIVIVWLGHALLVDSLGGRRDAAPWLYRIACLVLGAGMVGAGLRIRPQPDMESTAVLLVGWGVGMALLAVLATVAGY